MPSTVDRSLTLFSLVNRLPEAVTWAVVFRIQSLLQQSSSNQCAAMLGLPIDIGIENFAAVALTSLGKATVRDAQGPWTGVAPERPLPGSNATVAARLAERLALLYDCENADCVGFGQLPDSSPVVVAIAIDRYGLAKANALFDREPSWRGYDLLPAVGVHPQGGEWRRGFWCAQFTNQLGDHLQSAELAAFSRTLHCNLFFLQHGEIDDHLEAGLLSAASARTRHRFQTAATAAVNLILTARRNELAMTCVPPAPQSPFPCGDLVPMGLLVHALGTTPNADPAITAARVLAQRFLEKHRAGHFWPFQHGRLPSATDSALVLLGLKGTEDIAALETFSDGAGGYFPQLSSEQGDATHMRREPATQHWDQPDFATTCLIRSLRASAGLPSKTPATWLKERFEHRAGLFFANPYLVDWALALAIDRQEDAAPLRQALLEEILASQNPDGSFGRFDQAFSTAAAIVTLALLGHRSRVISTAQLQLNELLDAQGHGPVTTPFYSTIVTSTERTALRGQGCVAVGGQWHALSLYEDTHRMVLHAFVILAMQATCDPRVPALAVVTPAHPRYLAPSASTYIETCALPPYVERAP